MNIRQTGFTTMELLTTVVLVGVLMAMAIPSFNRMVANNRIISQTNDLVGALTFARSEAIRRNTPLTLCRAIASNSAACATDNASWEHWILITPGGDVLRQGSFNTFGDSQQVTSTLAGESIVFSPNGLARSGGALVGGSVDSDGNDTDAHSFTVCSSRVSHENIRVLALGSSSRINTSRDTGTCN